MASKVGCCNVTWPINHLATHRRLVSSIAVRSASVLSASSAKGSSASKETKIVAFCAFGSVTSSGNASIVVSKETFSNARLTIIVPKWLSCAIIGASRGRVWTRPGPMHLVLSRSTLPDSERSPSRFDSSSAVGYHSRLEGTDCFSAIVSPTCRSL